MNDGDADVYEVCGCVRFHASCLGRRCRGLQEEADGGQEGARGAEEGGGGEGTAEDEEMMDCLRARVRGGDAQR